MINGVRVFLPRIRGKGAEGHIVNTASAAGLFAFLHMGAYVASKFAIVGYSEVLRQELEPEGIGVSVLCPGGVRTRIGEAARNRQERFGGPLPVSASQSPGEGALDPLAAGRMVVQGIKDNRLYIHTDVGMRQRYEERFAGILADFAPLERVAGAPIASS
jgi:short-subunit dehydrogenase